jgi:peptidoglycan/xylan/chitin deacetylase (PgdA/CDA1 family)
LVRARAPATFFLTGRWVQLYPKLARTIGAHYDIGNHTYDHPDLTKLPNPAVKREIVKAQRLIQHATGRSPRPLFRFPFGSSDRRVMHIVNSLGYVSIGWTTDTLGWLGTSGGQSVASVRSHALTGLRPGAIILMHLGANPQDHSALDAQALPGIIAGLRQRGYRIVGIDRVLQQG